MCSRAGATQAFLGPRRSPPCWPLSHPAPSVPPPLCFAEHCSPTPLVGFKTWASGLGFQGNNQTFLCLSGPRTGSSPASPPGSCLGLTPPGPGGSSPWATHLSPGEGGRWSGPGSAFLIHSLTILRQSRVECHFVSQPLTLLLVAAPLPVLSLPGGTLLPLQTQLGSARVSLGPFWFRTPLLRQCVREDSSLPTRLPHDSDSVVRGLSASHHTHSSWADVGPAPHPVPLFPGPTGPWSLESEAQYGLAASRGRFCYLSGWSPTSESVIFEVIFKFTFGSSFYFI